MIKASSARTVDELLRELASTRPATREAAIARLTVIGGRAVTRLITLAGDQAQSPLARAAAIDTRHTGGGAFCGLRDCGMQRRSTGVSVRHRRAADEPRVGCGQRRFTWLTPPGRWFCAGCDLFAIPPPPATCPRCGGRRWGLTLYRAVCLDCPPPALVLAQSTS